jgi:hypothetical protein
VSSFAIAQCSVVSVCSSKHNSVAVTSRTIGGTFREPRFDNVHGIDTLLMCKSAFNAFVSFFCSCYILCCGSQQEQGAGEDAGAEEEDWVRPLWWLESPGSLQAKTVQVVQPQQWRGVCC